MVRQDSIARTCFSYTNSIYTKLIMQLSTLIIDDSKMQELLTLKMINENPNLSYIGSYSNPKEGLQAANRLKPDVIILDVEMPEMDGFAVLENLEHDCQVIMYSTR